MVLSNSHRVPHTQNALRSAAHRTRFQLLHTERASNCRRDTTRFEKSRILLRYRSPLRSLRSICESDLNPNKAAEFRAHPSAARLSLHTYTSTSHVTRERRELVSETSRAMDTILNASHIRFLFTRDSICPPVSPGAASQTETVSA